MGKVSGFGWKVSSLYHRLPPPIANLRHVFAVFANVFLMVNELVADELFGISGAGT
jgi:hypothetical protein